MPKILIVEDNDLNRDMLLRRLTHQGYHVSAAVDGRAGITAAQRESPDVILLDMSLPEMDGWEAARHLKRDRLTQHVPIIALTAHAMSSDRQRALEAGCDEYLTKPLEFALLISKIKAVLQSAGNKES